MKGQIFFIIPFLKIRGPPHKQRIAGKTESRKEKGKLFSKLVALPADTLELTFDSLFQLNLILMQEETRLTGRIGGQVIFKKVWMYDWSYIFTKHFYSALREA